MLIPYHKAIDERYEVDSFIVEYKRVEDKGELEEIVKIRFPGEGKIKIRRDGKQISGRDKLNKLDEATIRKLDDLPSYIRDFLGI